MIRQVQTVHRTSDDVQVVIHLHHANTPDTHTTYSKGP